MNVLLNVTPRDLSLQGWVNIRVRNHLLRYLPSMFRPNRRVREYLMEPFLD